jgi:hypothetical protein
MWGQPPRLSTGRRPGFDFDARRKMTTGPNPIFRRALDCGLLCLAVFALAGAGEPASRFKELGHQLMCICGCNQILLECNHVGCPDSDGMRNELMAAVSRGDSDSLVEQAFVQKYGPTVLPRRQALIAPRGSFPSSPLASACSQWFCWFVPGRIAPHPPSRTDCAPSTAPS